MVGWDDPFLLEQKVHFQGGSFCSFRFNGDSRNNIQTSTQQKGNTWNETIPRKKCLKTPELPKFFPQRNFLGETSIFFRSLFFLSQKRCFFSYIFYQVPKMKCLSFFGKKHNVWHEFGAMFGLYLPRVIVLSQPFTYNQHG